jgi:hypothetical protein
MNKFTMAANMDDTLQRKFTVAKVYPAAGGFVKVIFYESARFYKLSIANKKYKSIVALLKEAQKKGKPVIVFFIKNNDEVIILAKKLKE